MRISEDKARKLLVALGYENAQSYSQQMVVNRLRGIEENVKDDVRLGLKDASLKKLMQTIIRAVKINDRIELIDPLEVERNKTVETFGKRLERQENDKGSAPKVEERTRAVPVPRQTSDQTELVRTNQRHVTAPPGIERAKEIALRHKREAEEKFAAKKPTPRVKRTSKEEWPDLVATEVTPPAKGTIRRAIFEILFDASEDDPVTKEQVLDSIRVKFPDSVNPRTNVDGFPHWLPKCFPFSVHQKDKAYWLEEVRA